METSLQSAGESAQRSSAAQISGIQSIARDGSITVTQLIDAYMAAYTGRDTTRAQRLRFWQAKLGSLALSAVTGDQLFHALKELSAQRGRYFAGEDADGRAIFKAKSKPYAPATLNRVQAAIGAVFTWAIHERIAPEDWNNPCNRLRSRPENNSIVRFLSDSERERLFVACRASKWNKLFVLVLVALVTGARKGELQRLRWRDVDLEKGLANVTHTKNGDAKILALTTAAVEELRKFEGAPGALVFASTRRPDQPFNFDAGAWPLALKQAQIQKFRFHDLRHSCASYLAQNGATLLEIADVLGHRNLSVTKRYSHLATAGKSKLIERVLGGMK